MRYATGVSAASSASGEILNKEEFLQPLGRTVNALARVR
jgi:plasmid maintenance system antidote protein VapI